MAKTGLAKIASGEVVAWEPSAELKTLVRNTVFPGSNDDEMLLFLHECKRRMVHPLDRLIYPQIYTDQRTGARKLTIVTSIDQMRAVAGDTGVHAGTDEPTYGPVKDFKIESKPVSAPEWASVTVHKVIVGTVFHFTHKVWWVEYAPEYITKARMWIKMPHNQLAKCAEAGALRKGFPRELNKTFESAEPELIADDVPVEFDEGKNLMDYRPGAPAPSSAEVVEDEPQAVAATDSDGKEATPSTDDLMEMFVEPAAPVQESGLPPPSFNDEWRTFTGAVATARKALKPAGKGTKEPSSIPRDRASGT
jgi:phage recombination protein Bet